MTNSRVIRIRVRGRLSEHVASFFDGMTLVNRVDGSDLVGRVSDQAQLHGLLARIRDLGLELESMTTSPSEPDCEAPEARR
jgi:hypothetical protein